jgi:tRNA U34 2-thiouridine synthase MnmA/TrmU
MFMHNWDEKEERGECTAEADFALVQRVASLLQLSPLPPLHLSFVTRYWHDVFLHMLRDYQAGATPNPDTLCNATIKFDAFYHRARELKAHEVATGHYARRAASEAARGDLALRLGDRDLIHELRRAEPDALLTACVAARTHAKRTPPAALALLLDPRGRNLDVGAKDGNPKCQAFFLAGLPQEVLQHVIFPLGAMAKPQVAELAASVGLHEVLSRKESMGLCFVGKRHFPEFLQQYLRLTPGRVVLLPWAAAAAAVAEARMADASVLGEHAGVELLTLGQNARLSGLPERHYVAGKAVATAEVAVVPGRDHPALYATELLLGDMAWTQPRHVAAAAAAAGRALQANRDAGMGRLPPDCDILRDVDIQVRHRGARVACDVAFLRREDHVHAAADNTSEGDVDYGLAAPAITGRMPGVDPRQQWAANVWSAWRRSGRGAGEARARADENANSGAEPWAGGVSGGSAVGWVQCEMPHFAPAAGQTAVLYSGEICLGRARILAARWGA